jgi:hypothetical protein
VRFEDLLRQPETELTRLVDELGVAARTDVALAVRETSLAKLREAAGRTDHFWQGRAGLWRDLLPAATAQLIIQAHQDYLRQLGYECDPDAHLSEADADLRWRKLLELDEHKDAVVATLQQALFDVRHELARTRHRLARAEQTGPLAMSIARRLGRWAAKFPHLKATVKKLMG